MKTSRPILLLFTTGIILSMLSGCELYFNECINGNGTVGSEFREPGPFNRITSTASFDIVFTYDTETTVEVEGESNILPFVSTSVHNGELRIGASNNVCLRTSEPVIVYVSARNMNSLKVTGSGDFTSELIDQASVDITLSGSGDVYIEELLADDLDVLSTGSGELEALGACDRCNITVTGSGDVITAGLISRISSAHISGSGDIYLTINDSLYVTLTGSGNFLYKGHPSIELTKTGSGGLINLN